MAFSTFTHKMVFAAPGASALRARPTARPLNTPAAFRVGVAVCGAAKRSEDERPAVAKLAIPFAGALAAAMIMGAVLPEDALAAR